MAELRFQPLNMMPLLVSSLTNLALSLMCGRRLGYAAGHIPGAINLQLLTFTPRQLPSGKPVVLVRLAGGRSAKALQQAIAAGHKNVCHYAPGTGGWRNRGGAVVA
jgi:rhodanese-related sulfurtransferase